MSIVIQRFIPTSTLLRTLIRYFWIVDADADQEVRHFLLPVGNADALISIASPITYHSLSGEVIPRGWHVGGIREQSCLVTQTGPLRVIGIAFHPLGAHPLFGAPMSELANATIDIADLSSRLATELTDAAAATAHGHADPERLRTLERVLLRHVDHRVVPDVSARTLFEEYRTSRVSVARFCDHWRVHPRTFERFFARHVGLPPKVYQRLTRFQHATSMLLGRRSETLTDLAHESGYFDQAHFIREFRAFAGSSPTAFLRQRASVKQNAVYV